MCRIGGRTNGYIRKGLSFSNILPDDPLNDMTGEKVQIDGVAMGSPLAPVLANLFMGHHERIWLENYKAYIRPPINYII